MLFSRLDKLTLMVLLAPGAATAAPYGPSLRVNSYAPGGQVAADIASNAHGHALVLNADPQRGSSVRRFDAEGAAGEELPVGWMGRIAIDDAGYFATLGSSSGTSGGVANAYFFLSVHDPAGNVFVPRRRINDVVTGIPGACALAMTGNGNIVVVWEQSSATSRSVFAKGFRRDGTPLWPQMLVAENTRSTNVDVAVDALGNFVVVWGRARSTSDERGDLWAGRFTAAGAPIGPAFIVNSSPNVWAFGGTVGMNASGAFVVSWSNALPSGPQPIVAQRFAPSGARRENEFEVGPSFGRFPEVAVANDGHFTVAWDNNLNCLARSYDPNGTPLAGNGAASTTGFFVSELSGRCNTPRVSIDGAGRVLLIFTQYAPGSTTEYDAYLKRYTPPGMQIPTLNNGQVLTNLSGSTDSWRYFKFNVPDSRSTVDFSIFGGTGDADLYVRWGSLPNLDDWDGAPYLNGNTETARMRQFPPGDWYVGIHGFAAYSGLSTQATAY